jgi:hypothetical protein
MVLSATTGGAKVDRMAPVIKHSEIFFIETPGHFRVKVWVARHLKRQFRTACIAL